MNLLIARIDDLNNVTNLYDEIIDQTKNIEVYARWKKGLYPTEKMIRDYIKMNALYILKEGNALIGAMAVTVDNDTDYQTITWNVSAKEKEAAVLHILGVHPSYQNKGIGNRLIDEAVKIAKDNKKKALRLNALSSNIPAQKLYVKKGFVYCGTLNLYAENTGYTDFLFYEYNLSM
jgi:ribosomal protein S18 acetylase RimI-like enzyme